jgi:hypothetical protein
VCGGGGGGDDGGVEDVEEKEQHSLGLFWAGKTVVSI